MFARLVNGHIALPITIAREETSVGVLLNFIEHGQLSSTKMPSNKPAKAPFHELAPTSIVIAIATLIVPLAWNEVFNTLFNYLSVEVYHMDNGPEEIAMRLVYAIIVTVLAVFVLRRLIIWLQKKT
jgi:Family of unknown function (DUF5654)